MATYYDALNYTYDLYAKKTPSCATRLLGLYLLQLHNRNGNTGTFEVTDRELSLISGLSKNTITESKRVLKNLGLIDFHTNKHNPKKSTTYTFPFFSEKVGQTLGQSVGQSVGQSSRLSTSLNLTKKERQKTEDDAGAREGKAEFDPNDIQEVWAKSFGYDLRGDRALELERLAAKDFARAVQAINRTTKREGLKDEFAYFKAVYDGINPSRILKGGEKVEKSYEYSRPASLPADIAEQLAEF